METDQLRTFAAVVRSGSFTTAAKELGYVQSTVTGHLQALERRFGVRLLDRLPTGAVLTDAGERLLPLAERLLDLEVRLGDAVSAEPARPEGRVRLLAPESLCAYRLPASLRELRAAAPGVRLTLVPAGTEAALAAVRAGTTDAALLFEPELRAADLTLEPLGTEELALLVAPGTDPPASWAALAEQDAYLLEAGCCYSDEVAHRLLAVGQPDSRRTHFGSIEAVKQCVAAGLGWTVLPIVTAATELRAGTLAAVAGPLPATPTVHLATHPARTPTAATRLVLDHLRRQWTAG